MKRWWPLVIIVLGLWSAARAEPVVLFVAGEPSHGPGEHRFPDGCALLAGALNRAGLAVRAEVSRGWPLPERLSVAAAIVLYSDGVERQVAAGHTAELERELARGCGLTVLHYALEPTPGELADLLLKTLGARFEPDWSVNPVWTPDPAEPESHEVARGVEPFRVEDEWYFHLRFRSGITPVLTAHPPVGTLGEDGPRSGNPAVRAALTRNEPQTLAWTCETGAQRSFGFTGGHFHRNWSDANFRRLVLNGIAWTAHVAVPSTGVVSTVPDAPRYTTIDEAIARGDEADVRRHLALEPQRLQGNPSAALTPLHQAILRNRTAIALLLIEAGASVNAPDRSHRTPLHLAVERGNEAVLAALLARRAAPNERDQIGWTPLHHAAAKNQLAIARALLAAGADASTLSAAGGTALHEAAASGSAEMVRLLLDHGVDSRIVSKTGVTALDIAREFKNDAAVAELVRASGVPAGRPPGP